MTDDEFLEYKTVIQGAADLVKFNSRIDISLQRIKGILDTIVVTSSRNPDSSMIIVPANHILYLGWTENGEWTPREVNLAVPDSLETLGNFLKDILGPSWAKSE